ncbi:hypothetical protein ACM66B_006397 [Microbotryomycetes sp. NB124-2]
MTRTLPTTQTDPLTKQQSVFDRVPDELLLTILAAVPSSSPSLIELNHKREACTEQVQVRSRLRLVCRRWFLAVGHEETAWIDSGSAARLIETFQLGKQSRRLKSMRLDFRGNYELWREIGQLTRLAPDLHHLALRCYLPQEAKMWLGPLDWTQLRSFACAEISYSLIEPLLEEGIAPLTDLRLGGVHGIPSNLPRLTVSLSRLQLGVRSRHCVDLLRALVESSSNSVQHLDVKVFSSSGQPSDFSVSEAISTVASRLRSFKLDAATIAIDNGFLCRLSNATALSLGDYGRAYESSFSSFLSERHTPHLQSLSLAWSFKRARDGDDWQWCDLFSAISQRSRSNNISVVNVAVAGTLHDYDQTIRTAKKAVEGHSLDRTEISLTYWPGQPFRLLHN